MIKIEYTIKFTDNDGLSRVSPLPDYILNVLSACRIEASSRGCTIYYSENEFNSERIGTYIWESQSDLDSFNVWAEENHQYSTTYQQFIDFIELNGGTVERVVTEF